mmetsp:Transcript_82466/g.242022  ORF Transcript_82466/g.242022 Transcript_82466/m.242022 type:complete len:230 (-) Transcript_82466:103-792(-)
MDALACSHGHASGGHLRRRSRLDLVSIAKRKAVRLAACTAVVTCCSHAVLLPRGLLFAGGHMEAQGSLVAEVRPARRSVACNADPGASEPRRVRASGRSPGGLQHYDEIQKSALPLEGHLDAILARAGLTTRTDEVKRWCEEQGAAEIGELLEEASALAEALGLGTAHANRLCAAAQAVEEEALELRERQDAQTRDEMASLGARFLRGQVSHDSLSQTWEAVNDRTSGS